MSKTKKLSNNSREFLLTFFTEDAYTEKEVNGFWLIKQLNGDTGQWTVHVYTQESYSNYKRANQNWAEYQEKMDFIKSI